jgi:hypothetical protein
MRSARKNDRTMVKIRGPKDRESESSTGQIGGLTTAVAYIDTIELFFRYLAKGMRREIEPVYGRSLWAVPCKDRLNNSVGYRIGLHQPNIAVLPVLEQFQRRDRGKLCRVDIAVDLTTQSSAWIAQHCLLRWRRSGPMHDEENALYWIEQHSRSRRSTRDLILYADKPSKITGQDCTHLELRFYSTPAIRKQGFEKITDLIGINPHLLFQRHIKLVEFDPEALKQSQVRAAIERDKAFYRDKETSPFIDKYRASIPRRVRSLVEHAYQDRVQQFKNADPDYVNRLKSIPIDVLNLPNRLSWPL